MKLFELSSNKKKILSSFAGQWSSGMILALGAKVPRFQFPAVAFSLLISTLCFERRHESFRVVEQLKETFRIACGTVV